MHSFRGLEVSLNNTKKKYSYHSKHVKGLKLQPIQLLEAIVSSPQCQYILTVRFCQDQFENSGGRKNLPGACKVKQLLWISSHNNDSKQNEEVFQPILGNV